MAVPIDEIAASAVHEAIRAHVLFRTEASGMGKGFPTSSGKGKGSLRKEKGSEKEARGRRKGWEGRPGRGRVPERDSKAQKMSG